MKRILVPTLLVLLGAGVSLASPPGPVRIGEHVPWQLDTPHPYPTAAEAGTSLVWMDQIKHPEATYIAVHFSRLDLAPGDVVVVRSPDGAQRWTYERYGRADLGRTPEGFFATHIKGDTAVIELHSLSAQPGWGYSVDLYGRGYSDAEILDFWNMGLGEKMNLPYPRGWTESLCGTDDTEEAKCYQASEPEAYDKARAIARLTLNGNAHCTGWLVGTAGDLITNEHCVTSQSQLNDIDFEFMAEGASCGTNCATSLGCPGVIEASGGTFSTDDASLDYALVRPATTTDLPATYGYLQLRETGAELGERIYIVQHPAGWGKRFAMVSTNTNDISAGGMAYASSLSEPACAGGAYNDVGYWADTQGGSSGSPVLGYADHKVVALHHCAGSGGCTNSGGARNRGVPIQEVIADLVAKGLVPEGALCDAFAGSSTLSAAPNGDNRIDLSWSAVTGIPGVTYTVLRSDGACPQGATVEIATGLTSTSFSDTTVSGGSSYAYSVEAVNPDSGCKSDPSPCDSALATGQCTLAPAFDGADGIANQATQTCALEVTWPTATDQCSGGTITYAVHRSTDPDFEPAPGNLVVAGLPAGTTSYLDNGSLPSGTRQYYVVRATDTGNGSTDANTNRVSARPTGPITVLDWADDLESYTSMTDAENGGWGHGAVDPSNDDWNVVGGDDATTGTGMAFTAADVATVVDKWMVTDSLVIGATSELTFSHKYTFETGFDGGVLEISVDDGQNWADLGTAITAGAYNDTISTSFSSPIAGRDAWSGTQSTFAPVVVDLSAYAGESALIRWRLATDVSVSAGDWKIDDFAINGVGMAGPCDAGSGTLIFADGFDDGGWSAWSGSNP